MKLIGTLIVLLITGILLGCTEQAAQPQQLPESIPAGLPLNMSESTSTIVIVVDSDHAQEPSLYEDQMESSMVLDTYEIVDERDNSFERWQDYSRQEDIQEKWDVYIDAEEHELEIDVDADDFIQCENEFKVEVTIENKGDVDEQVRVTLKNDKLIDAEKIVDVEYGHTSTVYFKVDARDVTPGDYTFRAQAFRDIEFDRNGDIKDEGTYEGSASEEVYIAQCYE